MTIMTRKQVGAWRKEMADQINSDPILLDIFTRAYCTKEEEPMNEVKRLRLAAGLTQQELSELSLSIGDYFQKISIPEIAAQEQDNVELNDIQWRFMQSVCNDRIKMFKRDAGLTIKLG